VDTKPVGQTISRRRLLIRAGQMSAGVAGSGLMASAIAACGQGGSSGSAVAAKVNSTAGLTIPKTHVDFSMAPFADDTVAEIGMKLGYFAENGITIGPTPTGAKLDLSASIAPLIAGQVQAGSAVFEVLLSKLDNVQNLRTFVIHGSFEGFALFVPIGSTAKSVNEIEATGVSFNQAVAQAIAQFKGKSLAFSNDPSVQLFYQLLFSLAGVKESDFNVTRLSNSNVVSLALAGRTALAAPSGGPQVVQLSNAGLKEVLNEQQILAASSDIRRLGLINHSSYVTTSSFYENSYDTVLRMAAAIFRALDLIRHDPAAAAAAQLPFLNAYAGGAATTPKQLDFLHNTITHERVFEEMGQFFTEKDSFNLYISGAAQIAALRKQKVLRQAHTVPQLDGAKKVWLDMVALRDECDALLKSKKSGSPQVLSTARTLYAHRNYLDARRALATLA